MRTIRTARLHLVPVSPKNAGELWEIPQQPDLRAYQDLPTMSPKAFGELVASRPARLLPGATGRFEWMVTLAPSPAPWAGSRCASPAAKRARGKSATLFYATIAAGASQPKR